jgi:hypothetical protein
MAMSRRILMGLLMALAGAAAVEAQGQGVVRVTAERTSVRETPATDAAVVATVVKGDELDVLETSGAWFRVRVRSTSREGFVHSLFVERAAGSSPGATPASQAGGGQASGAAPASGSSQQGARQAPASSSSTSASSSTPASASAQPPRTGGPIAASSVASPDHHLGLGLTSGGLAFGFTPSLRFWTDSKMGFEVNASFVSNSGYSMTAISPSLLMKIGEPRRLSMVTLAPYWGAGINYWHFSNDFYSYYCGLPQYHSDCSSSAIGFGGFGGAEFSFDAVPKLGVSANLGFFSSPDVLAYGGLYFSVAGHWYFK